MPNDPMIIAADVTLAYESGLNIEARSQWGYVWRRFFRHKLAMASAAVLAVIFLLAIFAPQVAPYRYDEIDLEALYSPPHFETWNLLSPKNHLFGTDLLGRDYFSRVIYGIRTSVWVALVVAGLSTVIGTAIGAIAGYFGGVERQPADADHRPVPDAADARGAARRGRLPRAGRPAARRDHPGAPLLDAAGPDRARDLPLLTREGIRRGGQGARLADRRIIIRHMLPNTLGPIIVNATLLIATAILVEAALSFLGFGIQPPTPALGKLIDDGQSEGLKLWWLVTFPGLVIVLIALCINFIGDGLRDALDPTQRRVRT